MSNQISEGVTVLIAEARRLHNAPDEPAHSFSFIVAPDGKSVNAFLRWQGANIPFRTEQKAG